MSMKIPVLVTLGLIGCLPSMVHGTRASYPVQSPMMQQQSMRQIAPQQQPQRKSLLSDAPNYAFAYNDGNIMPYMTKTIAVPVGTDLEEDSYRRSPNLPATSGRSIRVFDPAVGRTRNYVESTISIPFHELVDLRSKFARMIGERYDSRRSGGTVDAKLQEIKKFFLRAFGFYPFGLEKAYTIRTADEYKGDLDMQVVLVLFVPEQKEIEVESETGDPTDDYGPLPDYSNSPSSDFDDQDRGEDDSGYTPYHENQTNWWDHPPEDLSTSALPPKSPPSFEDQGFDDRSGQDPYEMTQETMSELRTHGVDLNPFPIGREDQTRIVKWVKDFYASTTTNPHIFASYTRQQLEATVFKILQYMLAGQPIKGGEFEDYKKNGWANWFTNYLKRLRSGQIITKDGGQVSTNGPSPSGRFSR